MPQDDLTKCLNASHQSDVIKEICSLSSQPHTSLLFAKEQFQWNLGKGNSILFWEDTWIDSMPLDTRCPRLYRISNLKFSRVKDIMELGNEILLEPIYWNRNLKGWEWEQVRELQNILDNVNLVDRHDYIIWKPVEGHYSTKMCQELVGSNDVKVSGIWRTIWNLKIPHKIQLFLCKLESGSLPANELLSQRLDGNISQHCLRCRGVIESAYHIFWTSLEAKSIWNMMSNWWSLNHNQRNLIGNNLKSTFSIYKGQHVSMV